MGKAKILTIAGLGTGNPELVSFAAVNSAKRSDLVLLPRANPEKSGVAEKIILAHVPELKYHTLTFPMILDISERNSLIKSQLENLRHELQVASEIFFAVIGDSSLYSTGKYLCESLRDLNLDFELRLIPGISAHSVAAACARKFLAAGDEILAIIPGTAEVSKIARALENSDCVAIYKPTALGNIREIINPELWEISRVDYAGLPNEKIFHGEAALENIHAYLSILLLSKMSKKFVKCLD